MNIGAFEITEGGKSYSKVELKSDEIQINGTNDLAEDIRIYSSSRASYSALIFGFLKSSSFNLVKSFIEI